MIPTRFLVAGVAVLALGTGAAQAGPPELLAKDTTVYLVVIDDKSTLAVQ